jgi:FtsH-binding integral membrane protein
MSPQIRRYLAWWVFALGLAASALLALLAFSARPPMDASLALVIWGLGVAPLMGLCWRIIKATRSPATSASPISRPKA